MNNKHEFAIYIDSFENNEIIRISKEPVYHRIIRVLRLTINDNLILFNKELNLFTKIIGISKKEVEVKVISKLQNKKFEPEINVLVSLLKPEAFEQAIYSCSELGANSILPIITQKTHNKKWDIKYQNRLENIIISAAEQSKNFYFPDLSKPQNLEQVLQNLPKNSVKIYFDPSGDKLSLVINHYEQNRLKNNNYPIFLMFGPEGDLTQEEKDTLKNNGFSFCALTPTILRSQTAVTLGLGIFRSYFCLN